MGQVLKFKKREAGMSNAEASMWIALVAILLLVLYWIYFV
jgi:hypothetical protein